MEPEEHRLAIGEVTSHRGAAVISTCQRLEAVALEPCALGCVARREGEDAFRYLVRLAAGLESIVLGESEIVGQVREAARTATPELAALLGKCIAVARTFRRQHGFAADSGNLFDLALANTALTPERVTVIGSGPTARCIVRRVRRESMTLTVASRQRPDWAADGRLPWLPLDDLYHSEPSHVALVALGGDAEALEPRRVPADILVDVSTPRRTTSGDNVVTLRDLRQHAFATERTRRAELVEELDAAADKALAGWAEDGASPVGRFRQSAELVRREEVSRIARQHPEIAPETLEAVTRRLMNRLLHAPSMRMRHLETAQAALLADLFEHEPGRTRRWPD